MNRTAQLHSDGQGRSGLLNWKRRSALGVITSEARPLPWGAARRAGNPPADRPELLAAGAAPISLSARVLAAGCGSVPGRAVSGVGLALACSRFFLQLFPANPPAATASAQCVQAGSFGRSRLLYSCAFLLRVRNLSLSQEAFTRQKVLREILVGSSEHQGHTSCPHRDCCCPAAPSTAPAPGSCAGEQREASLRTGCENQKTQGALGVVKAEECNVTA